MLFNETLKIDNDFSIDEENRLFRYKYKNEFVVSSADNIESCFVMADLDSLEENHFNTKTVDGIGKVHFVKDERAFAEAVMKAKVFLTKSYYDKNHELKCFRKRYDSQNDEVFLLSARISKTIIK